MPTGRRSRRPRDGNIHDSVDVAPQGHEIEIIIPKSAGDLSVAAADQRDEPLGSSIAVATAQQDHGFQGLDQPKSSVCSAAYVVTLKYSAYTPFDFNWSSINLDAQAKADRRSITCYTSHNPGRPSCNR